MLPFIEFEKNWGQINDLLSLNILSCINIYNIVGFHIYFPLADVFTYWFP